MANCSGRSGGPKGLGSTAVGYWGRDIYRRVISEQEQERQRALLQDQLLALGIRASLYIGVDSGQRCACYKKSNKQSDRKCYSCHGSSYVPGYLKFGYETLWMSPVDDDITLTNTKVKTNIKAAVIELEEGFNEGYIESSDKPFVRTALRSSWEYDFKEFRRDPDNSSVSFYYSLDSGTTWKDIAELDIENPSSGSIRFRVKLERDSEAILSPFFEIIRARYEMIDRSSDGRWGPWILITNNKPFRKVTKSEHGDIPQQGIVDFWTAGMSMFDPGIDVGSEDELLEGPSVVVEVLDGVLAGNKYVTTSWQNSDPRGYIVVVQNFKMRFGDPVGPYSLIW